MISELLSTKLFLPPARPGLVPRQRLTRRLGAGLAGKLILVCAPAGFGKTSLVSHWRGEAGDGLRTAWVSLDESDNDPVRFWSYCIAALLPLRVEACCDAPALLRATPPRVTDGLVSLINELTEQPEPCLLAIDDYHRITDQAVHDSVAFFLDRMPPTLRLLLVTRADPPLPLARLRARGQLTEVRAADLRFTADEAGQLAGSMGLQLAPADLAALEARTEGWAAGLQLAALSLQGREDTSQLIADFSGSHRHIFDYLVEEVLQRLPEDLEAFLIQTAILDRLTGPLCDAITGRSDGKETLAHLERANLFVTPLDQARRWYRYHHLFRDLLRSRLEQELPEQVPQLHRRAMAWLAAHSHDEEAVVHALAAGDDEAAADVVDRAAAERWKRGELGKVRRWLDALPPHVIRSRPNLILSLVRAHLLTGHAEGMEELLQEAEARLPVDDGRPAALRIVFANLRGQFEAALALADAAERGSFPADSLWWFYVAGARVSTYFGLNQWAEAERVGVAALQRAIATGDPYMVMRSAMLLADTQRQQGHLREAARHYELSISASRQIPGSRPPVAAMADVGLAEILYERDRQAEAVACLNQAIDLLGEGGILDSYAEALAALARTQQSQGDAATAAVTAVRARQVLQAMGPTWVGVRAWDHLTRLWLARGDLAAAAESNTHLRRLPSSQSALSHLLWCATPALVELAAGDHTAALRRIDQALAAAGPTAGTATAIKALTVQALARRAAGRRPEALAALGQALALAQPEGFLRTFSEAGEPLAALLEEGQRTWPVAVATYVGQLLEAMGRMPVARPNAQALVEPLSDRELEVLRLMAAGHSNQEIANKLFVVEGTVKKHTHNIFGKLQARNRVQALARAQELGLL